MKVSFLRQAKIDIRLASEWYEAQREGLGAEFIGALTKALQRSWPILWLIAFLLVTIGKRISNVFHILCFTKCVMRLSS
jgi:hypothetical protein